MRPGRRWSKAEEDYMRQFYGKLPAAVMADYVERSRDAVIAKAFAMGIRRHLAAHDVARAYAYKFRVTIRRVWLQGVAQLDACKDDGARRILLGIGERFEVPQMFAPVGLSPRVAERVRARAA